MILLSEKNLFPFKKSFGKLFSADLPKSLQFKIKIRQFLSEYKKTSQSGVEVEACEPAPSPKEEEILVTIPIIKSTGFILGKVEIEVGE